MSVWAKSSLAKFPPKNMTQIFENQPKSDFVSKFLVKNLVLDLLLKDFEPKFSIQNHIFNQNFSYKIKCLTKISIQNHIFNEHFRYKIRFLTKTSH